MKYFCRFYQVTFITLFAFSCQTYAFFYDTPALVLKNKKSCLASPPLCLNQIDENITDLKKYSRQWYRLNHLRLLALWQTRDLSSLKKEIHQYVYLHNAPPVFLTTVYTLYAKMLFSVGDEKQGTLYANKAVELIKQVNNVSFDASRYAEIINLYLKLQQDKRAIEFIHWINSRIEHMGPAHFFPSLQTAIAHTYFHIENYDLALKHYRYALMGFIENKQLLSSAEGHHNVARALQNKKNYSQAILAFKRALQWMDTAVKVQEYSVEAKNYTLLRLIETLQANQQYTQAQLLLKEISPKEVDKIWLALYQQLHRNKESH